MNRQQKQMRGALMLAALSGVLLIAGCGGSGSSSMPTGSASSSSSGAIAGIAMTSNVAVVTATNAN